MDSFFILSRDTKWIIIYYPKPTRYANRHSHSACQGRLRFALTSVRGLKAAPLVEGRNKLLTTLFY